MYIELLLCKPYHVRFQGVCYFCVQHERSIAKSCHITATYITPFTLYTKLTGSMPLVSIEVIIAIVAVLLAVVFVVFMAVGTVNAQAVILLETTREAMPSLEAFLKVRRQSRHYFDVGHGSNRTKRSLHHTPPYYYTLRSSRVTVPGFIDDSISAPHPVLVPG